MAMKTGLGAHGRINGILFEIREIDIQPIKELDDLGDELSEQLGKKVNVVDVIEEYLNEDKYHSLITGKHYNGFFDEYNKQGFGYTVVNHRKSKQKDKYAIYNTILIFKEEQ